MLVKARQGFGSRGIYRCADRRELEFFLDYATEDSMVQAACRGEEFSIDLFCDLESRCLNAVPRTMIESKGGESIKGMTLADTGADRGRPLRLRDGRARRPGERPVLPRARRHASGHRHQPALRRRVSASDRSRQPLSGARARARRRRAARAAARRFPRRPLHDPLFLGARAVGRTGRYVGAVRGRAARAARRALAVVCVVGVGRRMRWHERRRTATSGPRRRCTAKACRCRSCAGPCDSSSPSSTVTAARAYARGRQLVGTQRAHERHRRRRDQGSVASGRCT